MVFIAEQREVDWNAWLPFATVLLVRKPWQDWHKLTVGSKSSNRYNFGNLAHRRFAYQLTVCAEDPVVERDVIADFGILIIRQPLIDHNSTTRNRTERVGRGHHRVRRNHLPLGQAIDKCRQGRLSPTDSEAGIRHMGIEKDPPCAKFVVLLSTDVHRADFKVSILDVPAAEQCFGEVGCIDISFTRLSKEQHINAPDEADLLLQHREINENIAWCELVRGKAKAPKLAVF